jgi:hypothetical protein
MRISDVRVYCRGCVAGDVRARVRLAGTFDAIRCIHTFCDFHLACFFFGVVMAQSRAFACMHDLPRKLFVLSAWLRKLCVTV